MKSRTKPALLAIGVALVIVMSLGGCAGRQGSSASEGQNAQDSASAAATSSGEATEQTPTSGENMLYTPAYKPNGKEIAVIKTSKGTIRVQLFGTEAPIAVGSFIELARKGFYDGIKFHRLEPGFVIQGGDPLTKTPDASRWGTGGPGYKFEDEKVQGDYVRGALAMANAGPNTNGSQIFICLDDQPRLPKQYNLFGTVVEGLDVVRAIG